VREEADLGRAAAVVAAVTRAVPAVDRGARRLSAPVVAGAATSVLGGEALVATVRELDRAGVALVDVALRRPTLDDVFLHLTQLPAGEVA